MFMTPRLARSHWSVSDELAERRRLKGEAVADANGPTTASRQNVAARLSDFLATANRAGMTTEGVHWMFDDMVSKFGAQ